MLRKPPRACELEEYYADRILVEQAAEARPMFRLALPARARHARSLSLRLGWEGPAPRAVQVGPSSYAVPGQPPGITDIKVAEIPVKPADLSAVTEVTALYRTNYPNVNEKILFVSPDGHRQIAPGKEQFPWGGTARCSRPTPTPKPTCCSLSPG